MLSTESYVEFLKEMINIKIKEKEEELKNVSPLLEVKIDGEISGYKRVLSLLKASKFLITDSKED